jgi:hypothetical protein
MPGPPRIAPDTPPAQSGAPDRSSVSADRIYHAVTIAAILLVLGSLWVF